MALDIKNLNGGRSRGNNGGGSETVAIMLDAIHSKNPKAATPGEDTATGWLLQDAFGLKAEYAEDGAPLTKVTFTKTPPEKALEHSPLDIFDLMRKKGQHNPMKRGGTVILERATRDDRSGVIKAGWLKVAVRDADARLEATLPGCLVSVDRERTRERNGEKTAYQNRNVVDRDSAVAVKTSDEFKDAVSVALTRNPNYGGNPVAMVRIVDNVNKTVAMRRIFEGWDRDNARAMTPEESFDRWANSDENKDFADYFMSNVGDADGTFEIIPVLSYGTGSNSLPSKKAKGRDDSTQFQIAFERDGELVKRNDGSQVEVSGFAPGVMMVRRMEATDDARWFATDTFRQKAFGPIYSAEEIVTDNLPADVKAHFEKNAVARSEARRAARNATQAAPAAETDMSGDDIPFGEPDHGGGLTPA